MILAVVYLMLFAVLCRNVWRNECEWQHRSRYWVMIAAVCYLAYYYTLGRIEGKHNGQFFHTQKEIQAAVQKQQEDFLAANRNLMVSDIQSNYPVLLGCLFRCIADMMIGKPSMNLWRKWQISVFRLPVIRPTKRKS